APRTINQTREAHKPAKPTNSWGASRTMIQLDGPQSGPSFWKLQLPPGIQHYFITLFLNACLPPFPLCVICDFCGTPPLRDLRDLREPPSATSEGDLRETPSATSAGDLPSTYIPICTTFKKVKYRGTQNHFQRVLLPLISQILLIFSHSRSAFLGSVLSIHNLHSPTEQFRQRLRIP